MAICAIKFIYMHEGRWLRARGYTVKFRINDPVRITQDYMANDLRNPCGQCWIVFRRLRGHKRF